MIEIEKSETADTRTCDWSKVTKEELLKSSRSHISDIRKGMEFFSNEIDRAGASHDFTKTSIDGLEMFHKDFKTGFETTGWWELHQERERHHLSNPLYIQDNVNLIDIIEMITDGVMAGMARSGEYRRETLPEGLLEKAFENTINMLLKEVRVKP